MLSQYNMCVYINPIMRYPVEIEVSGSFSCGDGMMQFWCSYRPCIVVGQFSKVNNLQTHKHLGNERVINSVNQ